jgi:hypothetical protein
MNVCAAAEKIIYTKLYFLNFSSRNPLAQGLSFLIEYRYISMGISIYNLFKAGLLVTNALAVLHPKRFLRAYRLDTVATAPGGPLAAPDDAVSPVRAQVAGALAMARALHWPLIFVNALIVVLELIFG